MLIVIKNKQNQFCWYILSYFPNTNLNLVFKGETDMDKVEKMKQEKQYQDYVKQKTPVHNVYVNMAKAFVTGGIICTGGQCIYNYCELQSLSKDECGSWTSLLLVLLSVILTGINIYPKIAKWGGAGAVSYTHLFPYGQPR